MEFKLTNNNTGEEVLKGETINLNTERQNNEKYHIEIKLEDGSTINRFTSYIDWDEIKKELHVEGITFKEVQLANINNDY
jgi:hypothetical protein